MADFETKESAYQEIQEGKFFAVISYISFLCIVTMLVKRDNKFALYHAKQGLVLFILEVAGFILSIIPLLGMVIRTVGFLAALLVSLWCIIQAATGTYNRIYFISDIAEKITI